MAMGKVRANEKSPDVMFAEDLWANPGIAPQLSDPHRIPSIEVYVRDTFPDRKPDIRTPRTDVYITHWEAKDPNDPFWDENPDAIDE